ncbi:ankyrin repeat domain-containing protein [Marimonas lutisalis]|uniref:ankyrin repeat domain-containing protein n=1 Tax=Marimonas lutisalis TaxID=2545756 RepID=UPI001375FEF4|nr:ankyrin repeat domain-containing protein [Marimonas lutisalis]
MLPALVAITLALPARSGEATDLHRAARNGDLATLTALLDAGADINATDGENETALHKAAKANHARAVTLLLKAGADPYVSGHSVFGSTGTPLHAAARLSRLDSLRALLEAGIDPNLPDPGAGPPLHYARLYQRDAAVALLESYGAGPVAAPPIPALIAAADPGKGAEAANSCRFCHLLKASDDGRPRAGPPLWNLLGRPKGAVAGYNYSDAMRAAGGRWTYADLNSYLANPRAFVPGIKMDEVHGVTPPARRAALIRHLRDLSDTPPPLPR